MGLNNDVTLKVGFDIDKFHSDLKASNQRLESWASGVNKVFAGLVGLSVLKNVGSQMIEVTAQFQKFGAILSNTLGSNSEAQKSLDAIRKFAIATPFEVSEITAAYVRWANMGLDPTIDRMQKIGDIASSLGAGFEQTAEAFKDLMVGQTKRIEEVGISATQTNGKIQLSFKGVNLEIEKNAEGVQKALDVFSQLNGVLGTSDAIAQTLGGKISNLADAWSNFLLTIGTGSNSVIGAAVESLTGLLNVLSRPTASGGGLTKGVGFFDHLAEALGIVTDASTKANQGIAQGAQTTFEYAGYLKVYEDRVKEVDALEKQRIETIKQQAAAYLKAREEHFKYVKSISSLYVSGGSLKDSAAMPDLISQGMASQKVEGLPGKVGAPFDADAWEKQNNKLAEQAAIAQKNVDIINAKYQEAAMVTINTGALMAQGLSIIGDAVYASMSGTMSFGDAILRGLSAFMKQFGDQLILLGVGAESLKELDINPALAVAAGIALTALAGSISKSLGSNASAAMSGGSRGSYSSGVSSSGVGQREQRIVVAGKVSGKDIVFVYDSAKRDNYYQKGG